jgi:hypothetical protein
LGLGHVGVVRASSIFAVVWSCNACMRVCLKGALYMHTHTHTSIHHPSKRYTSVNLFNGHQTITRTGRAPTTGSRCDRAAVVPPPLRNPPGHCCALFGVHMRNIRARQQRNPQGHCCARRQIPGEWRTPAPPAEPRSMHKASVASTCVPAHACTNRPPGKAKRMKSAAS